MCCISVQCSWGHDDSEWQEGAEHGVKQLLGRGWGSKDTGKPPASSDWTYSCRSAQKHDVRHTGVRMMDGRGPACAPLVPAPPWACACASALSSCARGPDWVGATSYHSPSHWSSPSARVILLLQGPVSSRQVRFTRGIREGGFRGACAVAHAGGVPGDSEEVWDWLLRAQGLLWHHRCTSQAGGIVQSHFLSSENSNVKG